MRNLGICWEAGLIDLPWSDEKYYQSFQEMADCYQ